MASEEFGSRISRIEDLRVGDLVFIRNTIPGWKEGVITHIGIASGNGQMIDRYNKHSPIGINWIPKDKFVGGIRLRPDLCP